MKTKCNLLILFHYTPSRYAAGISSRIKEKEAGAEIKPHTMNISITEIYLQIYPRNHFLPVVWGPMDKLQGVKVQEYKLEKKAFPW